MDTNNHPKKPLGWYDLPPEIRNMIYREMLVRPHVLEFEPASDTGGWPVLRQRSNDPPLAVSLLRTSKLVRAEAVSILYGENFFELPRDNLTFDVFFDIIGPSNARLITRVKLRRPPRYNGKGIDPTGRLATAVELCPYLKELEYDASGYGDASPLAIDWLGEWHFEILFSNLKDMPSLEKITTQMLPSIYWICTEKKQTENPGQAVTANLVGKINQAGWVVTEFRYKPWLAGTWPQSRRVTAM